MFKEYLYSLCERKNCQKTECKMFMNSSRKFVCERCEQEKDMTLCSMKFDYGTLCEDLRQMEPTEARRRLEWYMVCAGASDEIDDPTVSKCYYTQIMLCKDMEPSKYQVFVTYPFIFTLDVDDNMM
jgi:hypothetical protein